MTKKLSCPKCGLYPMVAAEPIYQPKGEGFIKTLKFRCRECDGRRAYDVWVAERGGPPLDRASKDLD